MSNVKTILTGVVLAVLTGMTPGSTFADFPVIGDPVQVSFSTCANGQCSMRTAPVRNVVHAAGHVVHTGLHTAAHVAAIPVRVVAAPVRDMASPRYYYPTKVHHSVIVNQSYQGCVGGYCNRRGR